METFIPIEPCPWSHVRMVLIINTTFLALTYITVTLRLLTRLYIVQQFGLDDVFMIGALLLYTVYCIAVTVLGFKEYGHYELPYSLMTQLVDLLLVAETFYVIIMICLKVSLGIFFLRIMIQKTSVRIIRAIVALSVGFGIVYFWFIVFQCGAPIPGATFWERFMARTCAPNGAELAMGYIHAILTALTDVTFAILPINMVWKSNMSRHQKVLVGSILVIGAVGGIASIVRINYIKDLINPQLDFFTQMMWLALWSTIEPGLGIIASSLATLRPLIRTLSRALKSTGQRSSRDRDGMAGRVAAGPGGVRSPDPLDRRDVKKKALEDDSFGTQGTLATEYTEEMEISIPGNGFGSTTDFLATRTPDVTDPIGHKIKKASWWRPPSFHGGLMTEIRQAARDVQFEEEEAARTRPIGSTREDIELAGG